MSIRALAVALAFTASISYTAGAQTVRPSGNTVPENLLRFSVVFDAPPTSPVLPRLRLTVHGHEAEAAPFLQQELWSPDGQVLAVLMHPGRVKTGLAANEVFGRALSAGDTAVLSLDDLIIKTWRVSPTDTDPPLPETWRVTPPRVGTRNPITVQLDDAVDAMGKDLIAIRAADGSRIAGEAELLEAETLWRFTPAQPWHPDAYTVVAADQLEDPAGNRPGEAFEKPAGALERTATGPTFTIESHGNDRYSGQ